MCFSTIWKSRCKRDVIKSFSRPSAVEWWATVAQPGTALRHKRDRVLITGQGGTARLHGGVKVVVLYDMNETVRSWSVLLISVMLLARLCWCNSRVVSQAHAHVKVRIEQQKTPVKILLRNTDIKYQSHANRLQSYIQTWQQYAPWVFPWRS